MWSVSIDFQLARVWSPGIFFDEGFAVIHRLTLEQKNPGARQGLFCALTRVFTLPASIADTNSGTAWLTTVLACHKKTLRVAGMG